MDNSAVKELKSFHDKEGQKVSTSRPQFVPRDFYKEYLNKNIVLKMNIGPNIEGKLTGFNAFEIELELATHEKIVVCKHSIVFYSGKKPAPAPTAPAERPAKEFPVGRRL